MGKANHQEKVIDKHRWLVSYADFITLLFAFFVVMYSMSAVNEGKFRVLADTLQLAFQDPIKSILPVEFGKPSKLSRNKIKSSLYAFFAFSVGNL